MFNCYGCLMCEAGSKKLSVKNNPLYLFRNLRIMVERLNSEYKLSGFFFLKVKNPNMCVLSFSLLIYSLLATDDCWVEETKWPTIELSHWLQSSKNIGKCLSKKARTEIFNEGF